MITEKDETLPTGKWEFDEAVTSAFDDMLARSIPQFDVMRKAVFDLGCRFVQHNTVILDLGCSRGGAMAEFIDKFGAFNRHVGVETSKPMLESAKERFKSLTDCGVVEIRDLDLRKNYPPVKASLTLCVLTLQFVPMEYRQKILREAFRACLPGGCLILVEKVLGTSAEIDECLVAEYLKMKGDNGYSQEQIERKKLSLEGILVPVTAAWNEELLRRAGFNQVDCFWRWMNFAGWLAIKD